MLKHSAPRWLEDFLTPLIKTLRTLHTDLQAHWRHNKHGRSSMCPLWHHKHLCHMWQNIFHGIACEWLFLTFRLCSWTVEAGLSVSSAAFSCPALWDVQGEPMGERSCCRALCCLLSLSCSHSEWRSWRSPVSAVAETRAETVSLVPTGRPRILCAQILTESSCWSGSWVATLLNSVCWRSATVPVSGFLLPLARLPPLSVSAANPEGRSEAPWWAAGQSYRCLNPVCASGLYCGSLMTPHCIAEWRHSCWGQPQDWHNRGSDGRQSEATEAQAGLSSSHRGYLLAWHPSPSCPDPVWEIVGGRPRLWKGPDYSLRKTRPRDV